MLTLTLALLALQESPAAEPLPDAAPVVTAPEFVVARAMTDFGFDLHRALAQSSPNEDLFVAPYSLARSFAILAEGARGETAREFHAALRWPAEALVATASGPRFRPEVVHAGLAAFARRVEFTDDERTAAILERMEAVRAEFDAAMEALDSEWSRLGRADDRQPSVDEREPRKDWLEESWRLEDEFNALMRQLPGTALSTTRALWVDSAWTLEPEYVALLDTYHAPTAVFAAPFATDPSAARAAISSWFQEAAGRSIEGLVDVAKFDAGTGLVQIDILDFAGGWANEFDDYWTKPAEFTGSDGSARTVQLMSEFMRAPARYAAFEANGAVFATPVDYEEGTDPKGYPVSGGFQVVEMPYRGLRLAFVLLVPFEATGLPALEARLTSDEWLRIAAALETRTSSVEMPRFSIDGTCDVRPALEQLGVRRAFVAPQLPNGADFSGSAGSVPEGLVADIVRHRATISVDERGTIVEVETVQGPRIGGRTLKKRVPFIPVVRADHPFLFVVIDRATNAVLFVGRKAHG